MLSSTLTVFSFPSLPSYLDRVDRWSRWCWIRKERRRLSSRPPHTRREVTAGLAGGDGWGRARAGRKGDEGVLIRPKILEVELREGDERVQFQDLQVSLLLLSFDLMEGEEASASSNGTLTVLPTPSSLFLSLLLANSPSPSLPNPSSPVAIHLDSPSQSSSYHPQKLPFFLVNDIPTQPTSTTNRSCPNSRSASSRWISL